MPGLDPAHWLFRLTPAEWLAAAETELGHAREALQRRAARPGVTHARRAAGMAWNALMADVAEPAAAEPAIARYGRSYMEHVVALAGDDDPALREAATLLRDTPPAPPELITLGKPDLRVADAAQTIAEAVRARLR
ncbi:MAG TPA: hypothetical protein VHJ20_09905 [Polyangia bacterium]|nr:hypothetical protein [Polyangia bacterium]